MRISRWAICALALVGAANVASAQRFPDFVVGQPPTPPKAPGPRLAGLPDPYRVDNNWAKMPPGRVWGGVAGITMDPDGKSVWFSERCGNIDNGCALSKNKDVDPILNFDASGKLVKSFGAGMFHYPHGITFDRDGNIWIVDGIAGPGRTAAPPRRDAKRDPSFIGNTVRKFTPDGKLLMTIGTPGKVGKGPYLFSGVSAVAVAPNGNIFVADGHDADANNRIVKYDSHGKYLTEWGKAGTGDTDFKVPHGLAFDNEGRLYVADRQNNAVKVYDQNGKLLHVWDQFGSAGGIYVDNNDMIYVADTGPIPGGGPWPYPTGFGVSGIRIASVKDGRLIANIPWGEEVTLEGVTVANDGTVYGGFTNRPGSHRFVPTEPLK